MAELSEIRILTGVTASGKTALSLEWAAANGAEILSCDTTCVYRGMDIGTAKPTPEEQARVRHHLIDLVAVGESFDIGRYVEHARAVLQDLASRGKPALVVGGSGFYLKSFFSAVTDGIAISPAVRRAVAEIEEGGGLAALVAELRRLDPADALEGLDLSNPRRVSRALERCLSSGLAYAEVRRRFASQRGPFAAYRKVLWQVDCPREQLDRRIEMRVAGMLRRGLVEEVEHLIGEGIRENAAAASAIGYREVLAYLDGKLTREDLPVEIAANTRRLAAKQRKWFRTQLPPPDRLILSDDAVPGFEPEG